MDASAHRLQNQLQGVLITLEQHPRDYVVGGVGQIAENEAQDVGVVDVVIQLDDLLQDDEGVEGGYEEPVVEKAEGVVVDSHPAGRQVDSHQEYGKIIVTYVLLHEGDSKGI